jgi:polyvinyl alcohol dehydrogenase (cytochrome)
MWNGWGNGPNNTRFQPAEWAGLSAADVPKLALKWALGFADGGFVASQPTVVGGRVYIGAGPGGVYSLDAASGCMHWMFKTPAVVRTAVTIGQIAGSAPPRYAAYFGDLQANVYAVDAETGAVIWTKKVEAHPQARITAAPTLFEGRLYVGVSSLEEAAAASPAYECCTFRGLVVAFDAASGHEEWRSYTIPHPAERTRKTDKGVQHWGPAGAAVWSSPTIDSQRRLVYVATGDAYSAPVTSGSDAVLAFDLNTGHLVWSKQLTSNDAWISGCNRTQNRPDNCEDEPGNDDDFGQSPVLKQLSNGRSIIVIGQKSGVGWGLDPSNKGSVLWQHRIGKGGFRGGLVFGSAADDEQVYFANSDVAYSAVEAGGLAAVNMATGQRAWFVQPPRVDCSASNANRCVQAQSAAVTVIPGVVFSGATNGIVRAYSTVDGKVIWEFDTAREFPTLNGLRAKGGILDGGGPTIVQGMLYMESGYATTRGGVPGNVLLAFSAK